ncbi:MAG: hypothetical protein RLZZ126_65 [Pseudomonadota bacterium]|jgi:cardiolipin synthase
MQHWRDGHRVMLLQGGAEFFPALEAAMDNALVEVRMETYIFHLDASGERIFQALLRAARRGVAVYLVVDGAGTPSLPPEVQCNLTDHGVQWKIFRPLTGLGWLVPLRWRRLHRKLCLIDGDQVFCGGINVLDDYFDPNHGSLDAPRFDFAVQVQGPLVTQVQEAMVQFWRRLQVTGTRRPADLPRAWEALQNLLGEGAATGARGLPAAAHGVLGKGCRATLVLRDNFRHRGRIEQAYRQAIAEARTDIIIANAYFVPGRRLRTALVLAARRGVRVRLLLQGRYEYFMQYHAARPIWGVLLAAGVEIHEYAASFLHAKVAVIDRHWATVGSSNLDPLSLLLAREANIMVRDGPFATDLHQRLEHAMATSGRRIGLSEYLHRPLRQRFLDGLALVVMRVLLFLVGKKY